MMTTRFTRFLYPAVATPNTTRIAAVDDIGTAVALSRFGWLHGSNAVILAPVNQPALDAAAFTLVHFPIDAPILLNPLGTLDPRVAEEIQRLMPAGVDAPAQVLLVGPFAPAVSLAIQALGFTTDTIGSADPISTAVATATLRRAVEPGVRNVTLISLEDLVWGLPATAWAAHFGDPVLFVHAQSIPAPTATYLSTFEPNAYLMGPPVVISRTVLDQVRDLTHGVGYVARITGFSPAEVAAHYARFFAPTESVYGWARWSPDDGQAFTFVSSAGGALDLVPVAGATLSHRGKHTPVLYVAHDEVPPATETYVMSVNPGPFQGVQEAPPFMHGFILGNEGVVSVPVQIALDTLLTRGAHVMGGSAPTAVDMRTHH